ncbi:MAG: hypothetical protein AAFX05_09710 [Planctomycetota bacterium]
MAILLSVIAAALCLVGLFLGIRGVIGRELHDHPTCAGCRFDLEGIYPESQTCPECGAALHAPTAIRRGVRKRHWPRASLGAFVFLLGALLASPFLIPAGNDPITKLMPDWILVWRTGHSSPRSVQPALAELQRRWWSTSGVFTGSDTSLFDVLGNALEWQQAPERAWLKDWDPFVLEAYGSGAFTSDLYRRYAEGAYDIRAESYPKRYDGEWVPLHLTGQALNRGPELIHLSVSLISVRSDTLRSVEVRQRDEWRHTQYTNGFVSMARRADVRVIGSHGAHVFIALCKVSVIPPKSFGYKGEPIASWEVELPIEVVLVAPGESLLALHQDEDLSRSILESMQLRRHGVLLTVEIHGTPVAIAWSVLVGRPGEPSEPVGTVNFARSDVDWMSAQWSVELPDNMAEDELLNFTFKPTVQSVRLMRIQPDQVLDVSARFSNVAPSTGSGPRGMIRPDGVAAGN